MKAKEHLKKIKEIIDVERGYSLGTVSLPETNSICMIQEPEKCLSAGQMNTRY